MVTIIKILPARLATPCDAEVQVRQAAQPRERRRQGRRATGGEGVAHAAGRGAGCHRGRGRGSGERGGLRAAERRDARGEAERISSLPGTEPIRIPPPPGLQSTKRHPSACRQGDVPELKPLGLGEGREEPCEARGALRADAVIPAGGAWGKPRSGQAWPLGASLAGKPCRERSKETPEAAP